MYYRCGVACSGWDIHRHFVIKLFVSRLFCAASWLLLLHPLGIDCALRTKKSKIVLKRTIDLTFSDFNFFAFLIVSTTICWLRFSLSFLGSKMLSFDSQRDSTRVSDISSVDGADGERLQ